MPRVAFAALFALAVSLPSSGAPPLFPSPLHITRQIQDPISGKTTVLHEYGYGNRLITVRDNSTAIADYEKNELIEIDRDAGTYSITRFDLVAKLAARSPSSPARTAALKNKPELRNAAPAATKSGRAAEFFEASVEGPASRQRISVGVDRSVRLSRQALEVLIGSAYPGTLQAEHEVILSAAASNRLPVSGQSAGSAAVEATYALPIEQVVTYEIEGQTLELRSSVIRVGIEPPPADAVGIPAGARQVESRISAMTRELDFMENPRSEVTNP
ncbi:MAG TPA: hypothetical protein VMS98_15340 [Thermoanaerobaculia bacterium]|nr:hypothetical protein [Thermoanaerobaculia bacterium]